VGDRSFLVDGSRFLRWHPFPSLWEAAAQAPVGTSRRSFRPTRISATINAGIPPYELTEVPKPSDLEMDGLNVAEFRRFAIAYGLSVPFGEGPEIGLPSQFAEPERPKVRQPKGVVDYLDSKDAYD
jgi:hypothetical protein